MAMVRRRVCQLSSISGFRALKSKVLSSDSLKDVSHSFALKGGMQKIEMMQESNLSKFKVEVQISQGHYFSLVQHEIELRYEIDKVTGGHRLDLNLKTGRIKEALSYQQLQNPTNKLELSFQKLQNLTNKLDRDFHSISAEIEAYNRDVKRYRIGTLVAIYVVGLVVLYVRLSKRCKNDPSSFVTENC